MSTVPETTPAKARKTEIDHELVKWVRENLNNNLTGENYENMISGVGYDPVEEQLCEARVISTEKALDYQNIRRKDFNDLKEYAEARKAALADIVGKAGNNCWVEYPFYVDYGVNIKLGNNFYANFGTTFLDCSIIDIGDNVMFGPNVTITTVGHPTDPHARATGVEHAEPVRIGNNVWISANVVILPGVTIGENSTVAAGAVVTKNVPPRTVVGGIPARVLKHV